MTNFFSWLADIISVIGAISAIDLLLIIPITLITPNIKTSKTKKLPRRVASLIICKNHLLGRSVVDGDKSKIKDFVVCINKSHIKCTRFIE